MGQIITGIAIIIFGLVVGGVGLATAGFGIWIPMIPLGLYIIFRGYRQTKGEKGDFAFEKTPTGKICLAILLIAIGTGGSALIMYGLYAISAYLFYNVFSKNKGDGTIK